MKKATVEEIEEKTKALNFSIEDLKNFRARLDSAILEFESLRDCNANDIDFRIRSLLLEMEGKNLSQAISVIEDEAVDSAVDFYNVRRYDDMPKVETNAYGEFDFENSEVKK